MEKLILHSLRNRNCRMKLYVTVLLTFFFLSSCSDIQNEETEICYVDPDLHINFEELHFGKYISETISRKDCRRDDVLVIRSYKSKKPYDYDDLFSNPIEYYCRLDREIIIEKNSNDEPIKLKCILNSGEKRPPVFNYDE